MDFKNVFFLNRKTRSQDDKLKHPTNGLCEKKNKKQKQKQKQKNSKTLVPPNRKILDSVLDFLYLEDK